MNRALTLVFFALCIVVSAQIPSSGLIGSWPFSGNANDVSGSANHGTVTGASLIPDRCGIPNSAYNFTGSDYITMAVPGPTGTAARSICFWARSTNTLSGSFSTPVVPFDYGGSSSAGGSPFQIVWNYCSQALGVDCGTNAIQRGTSCINNGQWHFFVIAYDPSFGSTLSDAKIYVDAVQQTALSCNISGTTQTINTAANSPVTIGKAAGWPARYFLGGIDDVLLYNRALTATEISQMYTVTPCTLPISGSTLVCPGASYVYTVAPVTGASYTWSLPAGWTGTSTVNTITVVAGSNSGSLAVVGSSSCGPTPSYSLAVTATISPTITATSNFPIVCNGATVTLTASGANSYTWQSPASNSSTVAVSPSITTTYTVRGTNTITGCTASTSITQTVVISPTVIPSKTGTVICAGNTVTLSATGATSYTWQPGAQTGSLVTVSPTATTIYTVTGFVIPNCSSTSTIQVVSPPPLQLAVTGSPTMCIPGTVTLNASASGGTGILSYSWTGGPATSTRTVSELTPGNYVYTLVTKDASNCSTSKTIAVNFLNTASVTALSSTICPSTTGTLLATGLSTYTWYPGPSSGNIYTATPLATSGVYTVIGSSAQGCTASAQATITVKPGITLSFTTYTITCGNLGSATVSAAGTPGPFSYSWSPTAQSGSIATGLFPGTYTLEVLDASTGCVNTGTTYFAPLVPLTGTVSATDSLLCYGDATGSASISLSGGSGSQTYNWISTAGMQTTSVAAGLAAGVHTISVVDGLTFCSVTHTFFIAQPPALTLSIVPPTPSVCLGSSISYTANTSGGTPAYSYSWTGGPNSPVFVSTEILAGTYTYTVSSEDAHACLVTNTVTGKFVPNPTVTVNSTSICPQASATLSALGATSYTWTGGSTANPFITSPATSTQYTVIGASLSCTASALANVVVMPPPAVSFSTDAPKCNGEMLHFMAAQTGTAYAWTGPLSFTAASQFVSMLASPPKSGIYVLKVTAANSCTASASTSVTIYPTPFISVAGSTVCENQALQLSSNYLAGASYNWSGPNNHTAAIQSPIFLNADTTMSGTYQLTLTSSYGCTNTAVTQASVTAKPNVQIVSPSDVCLGESLVLSSSGGDAYTWYGPGGFNASQSAVTIQPVTASHGGMYQLQLVKGPCVVNNSVIVNVHAAPQLSVNYNTPLCQSQSLQLLALGAASYTWIGSDGTVSFANPASVLMTSAGLSDYTLSAADVFGCENTSVLPVYVLPAPVVSVSTGTVCLGGPLTLTAGGGDFYTWSGPGGFSGTTSSVFLPAVGSQEAGVYTVQVAASNSCISSATVEIVIMPYAVPAPSISLSSKSACLNSNLQLIGAGGASYEWKAPSNKRFSGNPLLLSNITASMAGVYTLSVRNASNCIGESTVQVTVYPQPQGKLVSNVIETCAPGCMNLKLIQDSAQQAALVSSQILVNNNLVPLSTNQFCSSQSGVYRLKALFTDTNECANTATLEVMVHPKPSAGFLYSPSQPFAGIDEVEFHNNTFDDGASTWYWFTDLGNQDTLFDKDPKHLYSQAGDHYVTLVVKNRWGCADTSIQKVRVEDEFRLFMPNAFTPNGDGLNDVFGPMGSGIVSFKMEIFDRWGQKIFETTALDRPWDGRFKGVDCKTDSYVWLIGLKDSSGKQKTFKGSVMLLRALIKEEEY